MTVLRALDRSVALRTSRARAVGALAGLAVALLFIATAILALVALKLQVDWLLETLVVPTVATGVACGWIFGPRAKRATAPFERGVTSLRMAVLATALGDYFVGVWVGTASADSGPTSIVQGVLSAFVLWPFGIVLFGLFALPITFAAGLVWSWVMGRLNV